MRLSWCAAASGIVVALMVVGPPAPAGAQGVRADAGLNELLLEQWNEIGGKIVKMAEEFPEDKYDFRPVPSVRTFADNLRHVGFWNEYVIKTARGEQIDPKINELSKTEYASKTSIVSVLKETVAEGAEILQQAQSPLSSKAANLWVTFIEHSGEHYGQLVVYYRLNGLVPPASR